MRGQEHGHDLVSCGVCFLSLLQVSASLPAHHGQPKLSVIAEVEDRTPQDTPPPKEEAEDDGVNWTLGDNDTTPLLEPSSVP